MQKDKFMIYRRDAKKGEPAYSPKSHSAPHFEGHYVEGMEEWASWYCFNKKEDGTYEAELDEAWDEGSHYGGGTINVDIPKEWFALSYDDFLEHVITLAAATHYGFTVDDLKGKEGLKEFFGFKEKKILFLHGFYASGSCVPALALKEAFEKRATVLTPDLPLHPADAIRLIRDICDQEKPDVLVGNSSGSFYAQMISPIIGVPALLGNPHFKMSDFLRERIGNHQYKSPRADGKQDFTIDEQLVKEFEEMEAHQFLDEPSGIAERDCCNIYNKVRVWGLFGEEDTLAHFEPLFLEHYHNTFHFPGGHTPTAEQFKTWYVPLIEKLMIEYPISEDWEE